MDVFEPFTFPLRGKTFSLYGKGISSDEYFRKISDLADLFILANGKPIELLKLIRSVADKRRVLKKLSKDIDGSDEQSRLLHRLKDELSDYTIPLAEHRKNLTLSQRFSRTESMIEEQYFIYMLEIELANRVYQEDFRKAEVKLAFLPHCLHDIDKDCLAKTDGIDYVCRKCSRKCYVNKVTTMLAKYDIKAYIWMEANLKSLFKKLQSGLKSVGVFGMACVPELVHGMELCMKLGIPVIGQPIDANRCRRWTGKFHQTTANLVQLENFLSKS